MVQTNSLNSGMTGKPTARVLWREHHECEAGEWIRQRNRLLPTVPRIYRFNHPSVQHVHPSLGPGMDGEVSLPSIHWVQINYHPTVTPWGGAAGTLISSSIWRLPSPVERHCLVPSLVPILSRETTQKHSAVYTSPSEATVPPSAATTTGRHYD